MHSYEYSLLLAIPIHKFQSWQNQTKTKKKLAKTNKANNSSSRILCCSGNTPVPETSIRMRKTDRVLWEVIPVGKKFGGI
jgi:hypothetical protein